MMEEKILEKVRKEQKEEQKKLIKKFLVIVFAVGIICGTVGVAAGSYSAKQMTYTPSDNTWKVNNVSDAIDDLKFKKVSNNYSTEEQVVGTWIDGKPVYQKTFDISDSSVYVRNGYWVDVVDISNLNVERIINAQALSTIGDEVMFGLYKQSSQHKLQMWVTGYDGWKIEIITIQYTKTTDTATN